MQSWPKHEFSANRWLSRLGKLMIQNERRVVLNILGSIFVWNGQHCQMLTQIPARQATQRSRRGQAGSGWPLAPSAETLRFSEPEKRLDTLYFSNGSFHLKMQRERVRERGSKFNFLSMSEFPLTKSCLPPLPSQSQQPRLACRASWAGEAATATQPPLSSTQPEMCAAINIK